MYTGVWQVYAFIIMFCLFTIGCCASVIIYIIKLTKKNNKENNSLYKS